MTRARQPMVGQEEKDDQGNALVSIHGRMDARAFSSTSFLIFG